ncbi:unnamed protein product [Rotaria magnacalcarata]|uniref:NHL repeat containing protein n=1 Tax=Rotaria magnacalcarata TaxID=392030 RepID=A0A816BNW5_9BILA|nr:unnamed protein product [Rotaria magnacalcarata]CAF2061920.1 unnamed protein product [Rotaria magnacalcarata]CAF3976938.1 unnamed protein product [Rotaria magnacalcarata]CAF4200479.1 unnamed protein product [Rotaria magnacalcarata]
MTTGNVIYSPSSPNSLVGTVQLMSDMFTDYGQPCYQNKDNSFLICINGTFQCPSGTYFQDSMCQRQKSLGSSSLSVLHGESVTDYGNATAGNDSIELNGPFAIYILLSNAFFVSDLNNARVQRYSLGSRIGQAVAGNGIAGSASTQLRVPGGGVYVDNRTQDLYIADNANQRVQRWSANATTGYTVFGSVSNGLSSILGIRFSNAIKLTVIAGNGTSGSSAGLLFSPRHIYLDTTGTSLYIPDFGNNRVQLWNMSSIGNITNASGITAACGNGAGITSNLLNGPHAVVVSSKNGAVYVSDTLNYRIQRWVVGASTESTIAGDPNVLSGSSSSLLNTPIGLAIDADETHLFVSDMGNNRLQCFLLI